MSDLQPTDLGFGGTRTCHVGNIVSETIICVLISHWDTVRGPTMLMALCGEEVNLDDDVKTFLGRFALLSAVGSSSDDCDGIRFTSFPELKVGVTSVLFKAPLIHSKNKDQHVQYCLNIVIPESKVDRYVYLSPSTNDRLTWLVKHLQRTISKSMSLKPLVNSFGDLLRPFLQHLDVWMVSVLRPDMHIAQTLFGKEPNSKQDKEFLAAVLTAHLRCHQRTIIKGSSSSQINVWIRTLLLASSPDVWQLSNLLPEAEDTASTSAGSIDFDEGEADLKAGKYTYTPDLFLQGVIMSHQLNDFDVQLSRFPSCCVNIDTQTIMTCQPLNVCCFTFV